MMVLNALVVALRARAARSSKRAAHFISLLRQYMRWFGRREGLRVFVASLLNPRGEVTVHPRQLRAPLTLRLGTSDFRIYGQVIAREEYTLPLSRPPGVIIDAGANIGLTTIYYANRYPAARILALEPEASNFSQLRKNVAAYPQIIPLQAALWDTPIILALANPAKRSGIYGVFCVQPHEADGRFPVVGQVNSVTVPQLLTDYNLDVVDLLKVDIEGAEREVFASPAAWIERVGVIIIELHDRLVRGCALNFYTATHGFECEWHSGEHVIVARRGLIENAPWQSQRFSR
ncbi:FkbM family methyltransferase [Candidatus Chloroploca sp. Khr17]|uniref:FkbM family methyltransferase n=1 Tax=Candidatus Chloroploca sp. Khr17 TaxID=2496869 RepID=UPI00101CD6C8|nr:FkbM family methyltransferase [Candidatus Chloroploca sp. Khr17]